LPEWPKRTFDVGTRRARSLLSLYDVLHNTRTRGVRADWATRFKELMHWPAGEPIARIDGANRNSILILRGPVAAGASYFTHDHLCELLRAAHALSISALDRYFHDKIVHKSWKLLRSASRPKDLAELGIPLKAVSAAIERVRRDPAARPGALVKKALQDILHKSTFQSSNDILRAAKMLGATDFWTSVTAEMGQPITRDALIRGLDSAVKRRNQIVHESDILIMARPQRPHLRDIARTDAESSITFIEEFVSACEAVL
jgi:hypothetical protein